MNKMKWMVEVSMNEWALEAKIYIWKIFVVTKLHSTQCTILKSNGLASAKLRKWIVCFCVLKSAWWYIYRYIFGWGGSFSRFRLVTRSIGPGGPWCACWWLQQQPRRVDTCYVDWWLSPSSSTRVYVENEETKLPDQLGPECNRIESVL